jgi:hypothetical protein
MKIQYRTINILSLADIEAAERLKAEGWTIYSQSNWSIHFFKEAAR